MMKERQLAIGHSLLAQKRGDSIGLDLDGQYPISNKEYPMMKERQLAIGHSLLVIGHSDEVIYERP